MINFFCRFSDAKIPLDTVVSKQQRPYPLNHTGLPYETNAKDDEKKCVLCGCQPCRECPPKSQEMLHFTAVLTM